MTKKEKTNLCAYCANTCKQPPFAKVVICGRYGPQTQAKSHKQKTSLTQR